MIDILDLTSSQWLWVTIVCYGSLILLLVARVARKRSDDEELHDVLTGRAAMEHLSYSQRLRKSMEKQSWFVRYEKNVEMLIDRTYDQERTIDTVFTWQLEWIILAVALTFLLHVSLNIFIVDIAVPVICLVLAYKPISSMKSTLNERRNRFDENLPQFINHMCLGFDSGATISKAMTLAIQTLDDDARLDFDQLLIDYQMHTDDPSIAFDHLSERMPTEECRRFCNVTSTGLKNGNEMRQIFAKEADNMTNEYRTRLKETAEKRQNSSEVISTVFIFVPIIALMVAPLMASNL